MAITRLDGQTLREMFANGYRNLCRNENEVNSLNVFPVPDGDTGTNMSRTIGGGVNGVENPVSDVSEFMKTFSRAVLLSARGNSGVILSQFIRGISDGSDNKAELSVNDFGKALASGVKCAYSSVLKPTEGTMLTCLREPVEKLEAHDDFEDFDAMLSYVITEMKSTLARTPDMLPVLKEAGVVDSGGVGMVIIFEGMLSHLKGNRIEADLPADNFSTSFAPSSFGPDSVLEYGYCTEFILQLMNAKTDIASFDVKVLIDYLETIGDSIVAVKDNDVVKIHVHTFTPEKALGFARQFGEFITLKIENMSVQHNESVEAKPAKKKEKVKYAIVAVASGEGFKELFSEIGATAIIDGGQTQNPSAEEFIAAFDEIEAEHIIVLPNNSNIVMTAELAAKMYDKTDVRVISTKSMAQGYSALSMYNPWSDDIDEIIAGMVDGIESVATGSVAQAVHDSDVDGVHVDGGEYIGVLDGKICFAAADKISAALGLISKISDVEDKEVLTIFYGEDASEEEALMLIERIGEIYPHMESGCIFGGQKVYDFYIAVE